MTDTRRNTIIDEITRPRSFGYLHVLLAAIAGAVVGVVLWQMIPWTGSFDECYLREMRGQSLASSQFAFELCRRRFPEVR
jgi:hypothetical protein